MLDGHYGQPIQTWDYIVVGAGSAGCVLASRLTEDNKQSVLLLEAGGNDWSPFIHIPAALPKLDAKYNWRYPAEPDASRLSVADHWAGGKVLGGSSSINGMLWVRGHRADFDRWASLGCVGWDYESVLPYFMRMENYELGESDYRGAGGPQSVSHVRCPHPITDVFLRAAQQCGYTLQVDYNGKRQEGVGHAQISQAKGLRQSAARAFLIPAKSRKNLTIRKHAFVTKVLFDGKRAVGIEYRQGDRTITAACRREVILSAGAIGSPKLLMLSGIGPVHHLSEHGIPVVSESPGVGQNLQEHPSAILRYLVTGRTFNQEINIQGFLRHGSNLIFRRRGPATSPIAHAVVFSRLVESGQWPDFEVIFCPFGIEFPNEDLPEDSRSRGEAGHDVNAIRFTPRASVTVFPSLLHPEARGTIALRSSDPEAKPIIRHLLFGEQQDMALLIAACRRVRAIFQTDEFRPHLLGEHFPGDGVVTDDDWVGFLKRFAFRVEHPAGTCKMGTDNTAVVTPELKVLGVERLRVIDASVMPTLTSGNTNAPTMMIAEKGADLVRMEAAS